MKHVLKCISKNIVNRSESAQSNELDGYCHFFGGNIFVSSGYFVSSVSHNPNATQL